MNHVQGVIANAAYRQHVELLGVLVAMVVCARWRVMHIQRWKHLTRLAQDGTASAAYINHASPPAALVAIMVASARRPAPKKKL